MLPPDPQAESDPDELLDLLDGLILAGGADIDPATYGEEPHAATAARGGSATTSRSRSPAARSSATSPCSASAAACSS